MQCCELVITFQGLPNGEGEGKGAMPPSPPGLRGRGVMTSKSNTILEMFVFSNEGIWKRKAYFYYSVELEVDKTWRQNVTIL